MGRRLAPLPPALGAVFTTAEASAAGVGDSRLRAGDVLRIATGLYARRTRALEPARAREGAAQAWRRQLEQRALVIGERLPPHLFFTRRTAAALWRLPVPPASSLELELACFQPRRAPSRAGLSAQQLKQGSVDVVSHREVRVTDPASTWVMLAPQLSLRDAVALGDGVIRENRIPGTTRLAQAPLATLADLEEVMGRARRVGARWLREMLPLLTPHSASAPESHLRLLLSEWGLPPPVLDHDIYDQNGRFLGCSEFAYPELRLALEYEGDHHRTETYQWNRDIQKYRDYARAGWEVLRVTAELQYRRPGELRGQVAEALRRRAIEVS